MNNILTLETNKYAIKLDNFEGPLDLLCHLVDKNKMDINQIKISEITDQYIDYINKMQELNLDVTSEFILMASTLLFIKSKSLLPKQVEDEAELTEEELVHRIIEYKKYKEISKFPNVKKDIAFVVDKSLTSKEVEKAIKNGGGSLLTDIEIFDVYTGVGIGLDKKSMAYSLTFSDNKKTLTDDEVNALMNKIIDTVSKKCGAELRK